jgi:hypothetical protein
MPNMPMRKAPGHGKVPSALAFALVCALGLAFNLWFAVLNKTGWGVDFNQFYAASRLAGTGHLYEWDALAKIEREHSPYAVPTGRLPVELYACKIFGSLPYGVGRALWLACSIAALAGFAALWPGARQWAMAAALAWSLPAAMGLLFGQDVAFWLLFFAVGLLLLERRRPWIAGVLFSLCICKFHLALGIPVMLAAQKRWRSMIAGAAASLALAATGFPIEGPHWIDRYLTTLRAPEFSPAHYRMPTLYGIACWLPHAAAIEIAGAVAVAVLLGALCRGTRDLGMAGAAAAACGLILGRHAYAGDCALLIPLSVLTIQRQGAPKWLKLAAVVLLSPAPALLLVSPLPWLGQMLIVAFVVAAVSVERASLLRGTVAE